jgi:N-methylhydantoinase A
MRTFDAQLLGQTWETPFVECPPGVITADTIATMIENFHPAYEARNGDRFEAVPVQGVTYRVRAVVPTEKVRFPELPARAAEPLAPIGKTVLRYLDDAEQIAQIYARASLCAGDVITGPAIVREPLSTTHICRNQTGRVGVYGEIIIEQSG